MYHSFERVFQIIWKWPQLLESFHSSIVFSEAVFWNSVLVVLRRYSSKWWFYFGVFFPLWPGCGGIVSGSSGVITSPNFPQNYDHDDHCAWLIQAPTGTTVTVSVHQPKFVRIWVLYPDSGQWATHRVGLVFLKLQSRKCCPGNMPVIFCHRATLSTEYTVLTHIGVLVKNKINILYPWCKLKHLFNRNFLDTYNWLSKY